MFDQRMDLYKNLTNGSEPEEALALYRRPMASLRQAYGKPTASLRQAYGNPTARYGFKFWFLECGKGAQQCGIALLQIITFDRYSF